MILPLISLGKDPETLEITGKAAESPELTDAGARDEVSVRLDVTPLEGDSHLVRGTARGALDGQCARCLEAINLPFSVNFNLLVDHKDATGLEWLEDDDQGVEDYQARVGPDVTEIPLESLIAEQVLLNYNLHPLPDVDAAGRCVLCGREAPKVETPKRAEGVDPRWAKLREIKGLGGESPVNGSASGQGKKS